MRMIDRARRAMTEPTGYQPTDGNIVKRAERVKLFVVPDSLKEPTPAPIDYRDVEKLFANPTLEKEIKAMSTNAPTIVESLTESMNVARNDVAARRAAVVDEQKHSDAEFAANIARLNDEIKEATSINEAATDDFLARIADADRALKAIDAARSSLAGPSSADPKAAPAPVASDAK